MTEVVGAAAPSEPYDRTGGALRLLRLLPAYSDPERVAQVRQQGIGASEIAAVVGLSPWQGAYSLYHRKRGALEDVDTDAMRWGRRLEGAVADEFADRHPELSVDSAGVYAHADRPWQIASPDRLIREFGDREWAARHGLGQEPVAVLEVKTSASLDGWGEPGSDEIPLHYRCQVLWQMDVLAVKRAHVALLVSGRTYREYVVEYDPEDVAVMVQAGAEFWRRVREADPPPVDWLPASTAALKHLYPLKLDGDVEISEPLARRYEQTRAHVDRLARHKTLLENQIREQLGNAKRAVCDGRLVATRSVYERRGVDVKRLRAEHPQVAAACASASLVDKLVPARAHRVSAATVREALS